MQLVTTMMMVIITMMMTVMMEMSNAYSKLKNQVMEYIKHHDLKLYCKNIIIQ